MSHRYEYGGDSYRPPPDNAYSGGGGRYPRQHHGLPPRPPDPIRRVEADVYRPHRTDDYRDHSSLPPPPPDMRRFGQSSARNDFDFNSGPPLPPHNTRYPQNGFDDTAARRRNKQEQGRRGDQRGRDTRRNRPGPNRFQRPGASDRKLLQMNTRERTPPQLKGMNEGKAGVQYVELISSSEDEADPAQDAENSPPQPKWSNPETYTALPPPDESQRKRKDVVKLIRKSRMDPTEETEIAATNGVASNADFISLAFDDDDDDDDDEVLTKPGVPGAPTAPASERPIKAATGTVRSSRNGPPVSQNAKPNTALANAQPAPTVGDRLANLKRKRADEDDDDLEYRELRRPSQVLKPGPMSRGAITKEWAFNGTDRTLAVPWVRPLGPYKRMARARLHQEILDFYHFVSPKQYEATVRQDLLIRLGHVMDDLFPGTQVHCFGSFAAGLYLPDADMDVVAMSADYRSYNRSVLCQSANQMWKLSDKFRRAGLAGANMEVITRSKVPIIKFIDQATEIKVDISFENSTGVTAISTFQRWKTEFPAMPIIVMVIKQFLLMRGLSDVASGGIGGFTITCLVTSLLQNMPRVQSGELNPMDHLGEILIEFLDFYGNCFNYQQVAIRMDPPGFANKADLMASRQIGKADPRRLMIIDPNRSDNDISGGSRNIEVIFDKFAEAKNELLTAMALSERSNSATPSLLAWMLGGRYDSFLWYRRNLRRYHEKVWGPVVRDSL